MMETFGDDSSLKRVLKDYKATEITRDMPPIGNGTFGIVYKGKVKDRKNETVAIKDMKVTDPALFLEWKQEVRLTPSPPAPLTHSFP